ncbi:MAG: YIP1 family protein [Selenomonadales bacterium]|nr:YIP1 family protein [Selenomonadales bacterium]
MNHIIGVLTRPASAFERIAAESVLGMAIAVQAVVCFLSWMAKTVGSGAEWLPAIGEALAGALASIILCFLMAGLSHGIAGFMNGAGTWKKQFSAYSYCVLPELVIIPIQLIVLSLGMEDVNSAVLFITSVWCLVLNVYAIEAVQKIGSLKACIALLVPYVAVSGISMGIAARFLAQ